jgi:N-acetylmuramoyl-L-alanine amidase
VQFRKYGLGVLLILLLGVVLMNQSRPRKSAYLVLDPGHGGRDPGAVDPNSGTRESDLNLAQALTLKEYLVALGYTVGFTRTTDVFVPPGRENPHGPGAGGPGFLLVCTTTPPPLRALGCTIPRIRYPGAWPNGLPQF